MKGLANLKIKTLKSTETCPIHHISLEYLKGMKPFCVECQREETEREKKQQVEDFKIESVRSVLTKLSLVDNASEYNHTFKNFDAPEGTREVQIKKQTRMIAYRYLKDRDDEFNTIMYGTPGQGKTHLAMAMLNAVNDNAKQPQKCLFVNTVSLIQAIKDSWDDPTARWTEKYAIKLLKGVDLLVLDDLGSESAMNVGDKTASQFVQDILYKVTNRQHRIITTTNLTLDQLQRVYNAKLVSRLRAGSRNSAIDFTGITDKRY